MKRSLVIVLAVLALASLSAGAFATTYYVATNGNDNNPGTSTQPWATLQKAVDTINPGDTALVRSGTYVGCKITRSGQAEAVCTLAKEPGASVIINAPGPNNAHTSVIELENYDTANPIEYWTLDGFTVAVPSGSRSGFDVRGGSDPTPSFAEYITIRNSVVYGSTRTGIFFGFAAYNTVENCESYNNGEHGIYQSNSGDYYIARHNLLHGNAACGQHMNGDLSMGLDGQISYAVVEQNVVYGNGATAGGSAINGDGVSDSIIRNNLCYNNSASGISLYATDGAQGSSRNKVYNNTFYFPSGGRHVVNIPKSGKGKSDPTANLVMNNILYTGNTSKCSILAWGAGALAGSDYNSCADRFSVNGGKKIITLSAWRGYGFDAHSFIAGPTELFVDAANANFHLRAGSPAANTGTVLAEVTNDLDGRVRPLSGAYDIGCYEDW